ncbi:uncharacterized protein FIBRA_05835 [Fibroporia radiculosa]|uniref:Amidohydrolase-related domain-containing protein n=1 Tax=Fibroporia radiculosa TaxID=599839 RepID=J4GRP8_9APHY|nr:uncharacterized protein FIBRA_05835 [Fibroporia radiculosa]CCM03690.1 predicted protein [Fibroporia radiculosa]
MSVPPSLLASARAAYRDVLRASASTFTGDLHVRTAFRLKIRNEVLTYPPPADPKQCEEKIRLTKEIADVLRKNVVQAVKVESTDGPEAIERFKMRITEHTELGDNDTIKNPSPVESSRSVRKRGSSTDAARTSSHSPEVPRYYSQLKKAHKQRVVPQLKEVDLEESFVRGSGPGGQSINKTENNVQLLHKPTGIRVACQETRSLSQNRKLARRVLLDKLDAYYNPGLSKQEMKKALQHERQRRRKKKAKKNRDNSSADETADSFDSELKGRQGSRTALQNLQRLTHFWDDVEQTVLVAGDYDMEKTHLQVSPGQLGWLGSESSLPRPRKTRMMQAVLLFVSAAALSTFSSSISALFAQNYEQLQATSVPVALADPSSQWKDDIWPIHNQTPWDISTDYPYPRLLEYDVTEGTWLRLDVHPKTGEIVFDMLGDLYCLPSHAYSPSHLASGALSLARPFLLGVPHDSDPHFSPDGDRIVFRSDAELGIENIWVLEWKGCENMDVRSGDLNDELLDALELKDVEEELLASGVQETADRRQRRLVREGRLGAQRVTNETYRWVSDARFHPSGSSVIATKWYTSSRSLGAGEGWEYKVPSVESAGTHIKPGDGQRLVARTLPTGWGPEQYGDQQIGPEQFVWHGQDTLIYSKNVGDRDGAFSYSKDVHMGVYAIFSTNLTSQRTTTLVDAFPGGATRPELSRDGRTLAFVRRVRDKEALVFKDLETGTIHHIWYGLTYDLGVISAPMGTYPSFAFSPTDDAVIIWAAGQIYHIPLTTNAFGEKVAAGEPQPVRFLAHIEKRLARTAMAQVDIRPLETASTQRVYAFTELRVDTTGTRAVFQAAGATYVQEVGHDTPHAYRVPALHADAPYYSPSFVVNAEELVIHARWSDADFTTIELANLTSGEAYELAGLPLGRYYSPILCECTGIQRQLAFIKTGGDYLTGDIVATAKPGLYLGQITLPSSGQASTEIVVKNVHYVLTEIDEDQLLKTQVRFLERNTKLLVQSPGRAFVIDLAAGPDEFGDYKHETIATGLMSKELATVPRVSDTVVAKSLAFVDFYHVYYVPHPNSEEPVWSKPGNATKGLVRLSVDGGHDITWSRDGTKLFWLLGPYLHWVDVSKLSACSLAAERDSETFGIECAKHIPQFQEVVVRYTSDVARLKQEAASAFQANSDEEAPIGTDFFIISNATLLTMETGDFHSDILHDAILVSRGGEIEAIVGAQDAVFPQGATVIDVEGAFVVPGFIDVHAHWNGYDTLYPARSWEMETFLAYGVTTLHNPSADNVLAFAERFRIERGQLVGPRIFQVGGVIYGAAEPSLYHDIADMAEARSTLIRIKAEGGPSSFSYKNYNLPSRASRQRLLTAARELSMLCVPEGGMNYDWDLTYIVDGMTTIEHPLPIPVLYDDIITLYALSGTGSTPTHIVNYGGTMGEQYIWASEDIPNDPKLRRFTRHDVLERLSETTSRPKTSFALFNTSASTAKMVHKGLRAHIGAHGEPPLGLNYHSEMFFTQQGGLTNYEVIRAATSDAAITLGIDSSVGSLTPGKLADFVVYKPGVDLLEGDIRGSRAIRYVARGGRLWDAETMEEVWPVKGRRGAIPPLNPE